jgi:hypothetical protein
MTPSRAQDERTMLLSRNALVGAGRFERPTPCAQGRFCELLETLYFQSILFQTHGATLLRFMESS